MNYYATQIQAIDPKDGVLKTWAGKNVPALSFKDAEKYCQTHELGYCKVVGQLISVIPTDEKYNPLFEREIEMWKVVMN